MLEIKKKKRCLIMPYILVDPGISFLLRAASLFFPLTPYQPPLFILVLCSFHLSLRLCYVAHPATRPLNNFFFFHLYCSRALLTNRVTLTVLTNNLTNNDQNKYFVT